MSSVINGLSILKIILKIFAKIQEKIPAKNMIEKENIRFPFWKNANKNMVNIKRYVISCEKSKELFVIKFIFERL